MIIQKSAIRLFWVFIDALMYKAQGHKAQILALITVIG